MLAHKFVTVFLWQMARHDEIGDGMAGIRMRIDEYDKSIKGPEDEEEGDEGSQGPESSERYGAEEDDDGGATVCQHWILKSPRRCLTDSRSLEKGMTSDSMRNFHSKLVEFLYQEFPDRCVGLEKDLVVKVGYVSGHFESPNQRSHCLIHLLPDALISFHLPPLPVRRGLDGSHRHSPLFPEFSRTSAVRQRHCEWTDPLTFSARLRSASRSLQVSTS